MPAYQLTAELGVIELLHDLKFRERAAVLEGFRKILQNTNADSDWRFAMRAGAMLK